MIAIISKVKISTRHKYGNVRVRMHFFFHRYNFSEVCMSWLTYFTVRALCRLLLEKKTVVELKLNKTNIYAFRHVSIHSRVRVLESN